MNKIVIYGNECPRCLVLEDKMKKTGLTFSIEDNMKEIIKQGFQSAPILKVDGKYMEFQEAIKWVDSKKEKGID